MTFSQLISQKFKYGGWSIRILMLNIIVYLLINLFYQIDKGLKLWDERPFGLFAEYVFVLPDTFPNFLTQPWTWFTHMFAHQDFLHILFNMIWFYYGSMLFMQFLGNKRLIYIYILGGLFAALTQVMAVNLIPLFELSKYSGLIGASGAVYAVFIAVAFYRPMYEVLLFGLFKMRIVYIALFLVISDFLRMTDLESVAHMAHLGGAAFGVLAIARLSTFDGFISWFERKTQIFQGGFKGLRSRLFMRKMKEPKVKHYHKADEQYFESKKEIQMKVDAILDKIKQKGYDGLTKAEKEYLFNQKDKL
jgi:membrane associated rhomboid family serine protease